MGVTVDGHLCIKICRRYHSNGRQPGEITSSHRYHWKLEHKKSHVFQQKKCKVLVLNAPKKDLNFTLTLFGTSLALVNKITYLGVCFSRSRLTSLYTSHF